MPLCRIAPGFLSAQYLEEKDERAEAGIVLGKDDNQDTVDAIQVSPKVSPMVVENGGKRECGSKVVICQTQKKPKFMLNLEMPSLDPSRVHAFNAIAPPVSQQHSQQETQNHSGSTKVVSYYSLDDNKFWLWGGRQQSQRFLDNAADKHPITVDMLEFLKNITFVTFLNSIVIV